MSVDIHPALEISVLLNSLKTASARKIRNLFAEDLAPLYSNPLIWNLAYYVGSVGDPTLERVRAYVDSQGTKSHKRKSQGKSKQKSNGPLEPLLAMLAWN